MCSTSTSAARRSPVAFAGGSRFTPRRSTPSPSFWKNAAGTGGGLSRRARASRSRWTRRRFGGAGQAIVDQNAGAEPIEQAFSQWTWSRAATRDGATILYDAVRRREPPLSLALAFDRNAHFDERPSPPSARLPRTRWGLARTTRADEGRASAVRSFEDTPFYSRGLVAHTCSASASSRCMRASRSIASPTLSSASCFRSECRGCSDQGMLHLGSNVIARSAATKQSRERRAPYVPWSCS